MSHPPELELVCPHCSTTHLCSQQTMLERLRSVGLLRRQAQPDNDTVRELFRNSAAKFQCEVCGQRGLSVRIATDQGWPQQRACEICGVPIPAERLEVLPHAVRCAACEAKSQHGGEDEREFCPRCGEVLNLRLSTGTGISRYTLTCPRCKT